MNRKSAVENIFNKILGSSVKLEDSSDLETLKIKKQFIDTINKFESLYIRQENLLENLNLNLSSYDDDFFQVIESLIYLCFDPVYAEAILFYVYQRKQGDEIIPFIDENGEEYIFNNANDLWDYFDEVDYVGDDDEDLDEDDDEE
jgi:hypothetical protein